MSKPDRLFLRDWNGGTLFLDHGVEYKTIWMNIQGVKTSQKFLIRVQQSIQCKTTNEVINAIDKCIVGMMVKFTDFM